MTTILEQMADEFCRWPLPESSEYQWSDPLRRKRTGDHLLRYAEALTMFQQIVGPKIDAMQAKIDALMLEYCPDEMTPEQMAEWGANQRPVRDKQSAEIAELESAVQEARRLRDIQVDEAREKVAALEAENAKLKNPAVTESEWRVLAQAQTETIKQLKSENARLRKAFEKPVGIFMVGLHSREWEESSHQDATPLYRKPEGL